MDKYISELIRNNHIKFQSGNFTIFNFSNQLLPLTSLTTFYYILKKKFGKLVDDVFEILGERQTKALSKILINFPQKTLNPDQVDELLKRLDIFGYGGLSLVNVNYKTKKIIFQLKESPFCSMYFKLFGFNNERINPFMEGVCKGIAELILNCQMKARETQCVAKHKEKCYFIASSVKQAINNSIMDLYTFEKFKKTMDINHLEKSQTNIIKKIMGHNVIKWTGGSFAVWNVPGYILPIPTFLFLNKALENKFGIFVKNLLYHLGRVQARNAINLQVEYYGFKRDKKLMLSILEQTELAGVGISKLENVDFKNKTLSIYGLFNPYPRYYKTFFGKSDLAVDDYLRGLITGIGEGIFNESMEGEEIKCISKGDPYCLYNVEIMKKNSKYNLSRKYLDILDDKMNLKNFVL